MNYYCTSVTPVEDPRKPGERVCNVTVYGLVSTPPADASVIENVGDEVEFAVGSVYLYPDGGETWFWLSDDQWHKWGG